MISNRRACGYATLPIFSTTAGASPRRIRRCRDPPRRSPSRCHRSRRRCRTDRLAERLVDEIVYLDPLRLPLRTPLPAPVAILSTNSFFLVSTETTGCRRAWKARPRRLICLNCASRSACWAPSSVLRCLQAVAQLVQQPVDRTLAHRMAGAPQVLSQPRRAAAGPQQRPHRVAAGDRVDQPLQRLHQVRIVGGQRPAARAGSSQAPAVVARTRRFVGSKFLQPGINGGPRHPSGGGEAGDAATAHRARLPQPSAGAGARRTTEQGQRTWS